MNRESKPEIGRQRPDEGGEHRTLSGTPKRKRTSPMTFLREVRGELRRVAWPSLREVRSYSIVVLVTVTLLTVYVALIDAAFGRAMFQIFG
jgi:preprotein translocase subunit SecE